MSNIAPPSLCRVIRQDLPYEKQVIKVTGITAEQ